MNAARGAAEAARRFAATNGANHPLTTREFTMESLMANRGERGVAEAAARFHNNTSARRALADLKRAVANLENSSDDAA